MPDIRHDWSKTSFKGLTDITLGSANFAFSSPGSQGHVRTKVGVSGIFVRKTPGLHFYPAPLARSIVADNNQGRP
jgi:hypothetical protein